MIHYLYKNLCWSLRKNPFARLICPACTERDYIDMLQRLLRRPFADEKGIDVTETEFCLNRLALVRPRDEAQSRALEHLGKFSSQFLRVKRLFMRKYLRFPASDGVTRIESIAELLCKCTQFALTESQLKALLARTRAIASLTDREDRYLGEAVRLYAIRYYYAAFEAMRQGDKGVHLARFLQPILLKSEFCANSRYRQTAYAAADIATTLNCLGSSAARLGPTPTHTDVKLFVYADGRNVFDTFVRSRFGDRQAEFYSETNALRLDMRYFLYGNSEVRQCLLTNRGKRTRKFTIEIPFRASGDNTPFRVGNALCSAGEVFTALALVHDAHITECYGDNALLYDIVLRSGESYAFDLVTLYSAAFPALTEGLDALERFGATRCPYIHDNACTRISEGAPLTLLSPHGCDKLRPRRKLSTQPDFTYQLGDSDVATFLDANGCSATLLGGFPFGLRGESVCAVHNGLLSRLDCDRFSLDGDKLLYDKPFGTLCVHHDGGKAWQVNYPKPTRTLFYFPLERKSTIRYDAGEGLFTIDDGERRYTLRCLSRVESYTDNALECSEDKLRYKLSNTLGAGNCLALCCAPATELTLVLTPSTRTPESAPLIKESLVSTYLNYVNDKSVFCLNNRLKRPDCLTLAAICYTNPQFVRDYLIKAAVGTYSPRYYDAKGRLHAFRDRLAPPLATVYYLNLVGELPDDVVTNARNALFDEQYSGKELCVRALALLRAAKLETFDKVKCLVEYGKVKKVICADSTLYGYAQAIGAVPLAHPSKERLKDLCNKHEIPKSWYYVSQLENLYGLSISAGKLQITPTAHTNALEQFALYIAGKRIDTTFTRASTQCMTLNGMPCFSPFYAPSLKNADNQLVVSY